MSLFITLSTVLFLALIGYHLVYGSPGGRFHLSGAAFLLVGYLLGPDLLGILDEKTATELYPLSGLVTGWVGLMYGLQLDLPFMKRLTPPFMLAVFLDTGMTLLLFFAMSLALFPLLGSGYSLSLALVTAATAACSSQAALVMASPGLKPTRAVTALMRIATAGSLLSLGVFAAAFFFSAPNPSSDRLSMTIQTDLPMVLMSTAVLVVLYTLFFSERRSREELILIVTGMVVLTSGLAATHHFSPLLANGITGFFLGNTTRYRDRILSMVIILEKPLYLLLLILLGARAIPFSQGLLLTAALYLLLRTMAKLGGGCLISLFHTDVTMPRNAGTGLMEQGGLALALCFDAQHAFADPITHNLVTAILLATLASDLTGRLTWGELIPKRENMP
ncbi:hypothetical protein [Desulfoluna spongiiphila]|uniref:Kef-type K+ transport system, membrane component KefB n=1 Tax=Desulfoluna spongiiphila TaxID=419481 RepID=A0A1G5I1W7_9BACT|nr:hypothetical protein [Desulfoluna spongiiphila]SCY70115.1 Kef-type K+ transport system, membrane component KefB [Desulfoluna spongiiphila]